MAQNNVALAVHIVIAGNHVVRPAVAYGDTIGLQAQQSERDKQGRLEEHTAGAGMTNRPRLMLITRRVRGGIELRTA